MLKSLKNWNIFQNSKKTKQKHILSALKWDIYHSSTSTIDAIIRHEN